MLDATETSCCITSLYQCKGYPHCPPVLTASSNFTKMWFSSSLWRQLHTLSIVSFSSHSPLASSIAHTRSLLYMYNSNKNRMTHYIHTPTLEVQHTHESFDNSPPQPVNGFRGEDLPPSPSCCDIIYETQPSTCQEVRFWILFRIFQKNHLGDTLSVLKYEPIRHENWLIYKFVNKCYQVNNPTPPHHRGASPISTQRHKGCANIWHRTTQRERKRLVLCIEG